MFFWMLIGSGKKKLELGRSECCPDEKQSKIVYKFRLKHGKTRTHNSSFLRERMGGFAIFLGRKKKGFDFSKTERTFISQCN